MPNRFKRRITVKIIMLDTKSMPPLWRWAVRIGVVLLWAALMAAAIRYRWHQSSTYKDAIKREEAHAYYKERCKSAGIFIYRKISGENTLYLINRRPHGQPTLAEHGDKGQYTIIDPYGWDFDPFSYEDDYSLHILTYLGLDSVPPLPVPFKAVEVVDDRDGNLYRHTGVMAPITKDGRVVYRVQDSRIKIKSVTARYGLQFEDISTLEDRARWVAGSALNVIDLKTNEIVAIRIGYLWGPGMGVSVAGRTPWAEAERYACPSFEPRRYGGWLSRGGQSARFAAQVLNPGAAL